MASSHVTNKSYQPTPTGLLLIVHDHGAYSTLSSRGFLFSISVGREAAKTSREATNELALTAMTAF